MRPKLEEEPAGREGGQSSTEQIRISHFEATPLWLLVHVGHEPFTSSL